MAYSDERRISLFTGPNGPVTSAAHLVQGFTQATVQNDGSTTALAIRGSNDEGFNSSIVTWSTLTTITAAGMYTLDTGYRWLSGTRHSDDSDGWVAVVMTK